jgi:hypothetical protein
MNCHVQEHATSALRYRSDDRTSTEQRRKCERDRTYKIRLECESIGHQLEHSGATEKLQPCEVVNVKTREISSQPAQDRAAVFSCRVVILAIAVLLVGGREGLAQAADSHVDVGAHYSALVLGNPGRSHSGVGGWFAYRFFRGIALDGNVSVFPGENEPGGRVSQALLGASLGWRGERIGVFGKVRPGLIHFSDRFIAPGVVCIAIFPTPESCLIDAANLAIDVGGVFNVYPTRSTVVRVDVGNTALRVGSHQPSAEWTQHLQVNIGAGWRF